MDPIIRFENLVKRFGRVRAVDGLSLNVPPGKVTAFLGPNGAGKTTTIKTMLNMYRPDSGKVTVMGCDSTKLGPRELQRIGYVSENQRLPALDDRTLLHRLLPGDVPAMGRYVLQEAPRSV